MPTRSFVQTKKELQRLYEEKGEPISSRQAHRLAQGVMLSEFAENARRSAPAENYFRDFTDETGETAVKNVILRDYLRHYQANTASTRNEKNGLEAQSAKIRFEAVQSNTHERA